ncbi:unnamed protein product [Cochlearia groenlandica]
MDTYNTIVVIICISLFGINLVFCCFTCFSVLHSFMTETNQDLSDLRQNLIKPEDAKPEDEKVIIITVSSNQRFSDDDCGGQDCSHDICAC